MNLASKPCGASLASHTCTAYLYGSFLASIHLCFSPLRRNACKLFHLAHSSLFTWYSLLLYCTAPLKLLVPVKRPQ